MGKHTREILTLVGISVGSTVLMWLAVGMKMIYENFDGSYYGVVAQTWYQRSLISLNFSFPLPLEYYPAHLPLYPVVMKLGGFITGNVLSGGVVMTAILSAIGSAIIYWIWTKNSWRQPFWTALAWMFIWPRMWAVRSIASPETLFVVLIVLSLYFFDKKKYIFAGLFGALAVLTKTPGLLLFVAYGIWWLENTWRAKKIRLDIWPIMLIPGAFIAVCGFYFIQTGDALAYFNSGDNIHLQVMPFKIFDSNQSWVGSFWLEDVMWIYLVGGLGVYQAYKKNKVWGWFGIVFMTAIFFVSHRDISRYSLPVVPVILLGLGELLEKKSVRIALLLWLIPMAFFTINFLNYNRVDIANFAPFLVR